MTTTHCHTVLPQKDPEGAHQYLRFTPQEDVTMVRLLESRSEREPDDVFFTWTGDEPQTLGAAP
jgi:hypothetical protein